MADTAAQLVDPVLPRVPVRQWVLTHPFGLRFRLAHDAAPTTEILRLFIRVVFASLRRRARQGDQSDEVDPFCQDQPLLASLYDASVRQRVATGPRTGQQVASGRLEQLADGRLSYRLKHRWRDGTTHMVFTPMEFMEKLAALVPAPPDRTRVL